MGILDGKVAVITGSTGGLGLAIARTFAQAGATVVISGRNETTVQEVCARLTGEGLRASGITADVSDFVQVQQLARHAVEAAGKIDIWVNNAGIAGAYGPTAAIEPIEFERVVKTVIFGEYYGSLVAIQQFQKQQSGGKLINLLGRGDKQPVAFQSAYGSSKAWVRNFTLALAKEYRNTNIGIYALNPGLVDTAMLRKVEAVEGYESRLKALSTIIRLWAKPPQEPAQRALWLASSATDGKTGLEIQVLDKRAQLAGALGELRRRILRQPGPDDSISIRTLPVFHMEL